MSENRDKVYDPDPGKGFTRPNYRKLKKKQAGYRATTK